MLKFKWEKWGMVLLLASCVLTGCGPTISLTKSSDDQPLKPAAPDFCATASPIYIDKTDQISDGTAREILKHNMTGRKLCGW